MSKLVLFARQHPLLILCSLIVASVSAPNPVGGLEQNSDFVAEKTSTKHQINPDLIRDVGEISFPEPVAPPGLAPTDTVYLMGGAEQLSGKFQDDAGLPDRQGWLGIDVTQPRDVNWNISTFNAANLDTTVEENHAWWCGALFPPCDPEDSPEGYGNEWLEWLDWYGTVPNPEIEVTVRVKAQLNIDVEPDLDYLYLQYETVEGMRIVSILTALYSGVDFDETFVVTPAEFVGEQNNEVHLRWVVISDYSWSDEDCIWPTDTGAVQIDRIEVFFDQGDQEIQIGTTETCEPGDPVQWQMVLPQGSGDFSKVWPLLDDLDPDHQNDTPQFGFIDDGEVVPGTGGYLCETWCYGPGGYIVNPDGGLPGPWRYIKNEIWSPVLQKPAGDLTGALFSFDVYVHVENYAGGPWILHYWKVRSKDELTGPGSWTEWRDSHLWYGGGPNYVREHHYISDLLLPDYTHLQLALGIVDLQPYSGLTDGTPAPYFDNVTLKVYEEGGPNTYIVRPDGSGDFPTIQTAISAATDYDTILLADGIYTGQGNRDINYQDKILVVGSQSGDPTTCVIDCQGSQGDYHRGFNFFRYDGPEIVLEGVTIRNGYSDFSGGGIACQEASPTIRNCIIEYNTTLGSTHYGGGLYCKDASPVVTDCVFRGNVGYRGGAIGIGWDSQPVISNCLFVSNITNGSGSAVSCWYTECRPTVVSCTFMANEGPGSNGVISSRYLATLQVQNSIIAHNVSGMSVFCSDGGSVSLTCCDIFGNPDGDWVSCIADQQGEAGNFNLDPLFCGDLNPLDPVTLMNTSPCSPAFNPVCGLIGARPVACFDPTPVDESSTIPGSPLLLQNTPNPFNPQTTIRYELPMQATVTLGIFDVAGRLVDILVEGESISAGTHTATWNGQDSHGRTLPSGTYFYRLEAGEHTETKRMTLIR